jgi:ferredoxin/flavodoxin
MSETGAAMKAMIFYFSQTGNTERVALGVGRGLEAAGGTCRTVALAEARPEMAAEADLVGIGAPVFYYKEPTVVRDFIARLPAARRKPAFTFITHGGNPVNTLRRMQKQLARRGYTVINSFTALGYDTYPMYFKSFREWSRPNADELRLAAEFGGRLPGEVRRFREERHFALPRYKFVGGPYFFRSLVCRGGMMKRIFPRLAADEKICTRCGTCRKNCPTGAITLAPYPQIDNKCMWCYLCERICPVQAFTTDWEPIREKLKV